MVLEKLKTFFLVFLFPVFLLAQAPGAPRPAQPQGTTMGWWAVWWVWVIVFLVVVALVWAWAASGGGRGGVSGGGATNRTGNTRPVA